MKKFTFLLLIVVSHLTFAQSTEILPGLVLPQMTTAQRTAMVNPANGSLIFDTNTQSYWYRQSGAWAELPKAGSTANYWQLAGMAGNEIQNTNSGGFWSKNTTDVKIEADSITNPPTAPVNEAGTRLMWIPNRSAFRAGTVNNTGQWAADSIGLFSFATGYNVLASGKGTMAMGVLTKAKGEGSTAIGYMTSANGIVSTAMGYATEARGNSSTALGSGTLAGGIASIAGGNLSTANGDYAVAFGEQAIASGTTSVAMGTKVSTNTRRGGFVLGDSDPDNEGQTLASLHDQFTARFKNGYIFYTSGSDTRVGVKINSGQTAWSSISDSTRKEKFVKADGEVFLTKLRNLRLGSWNYKGQKTNKPERFYGPMAQEIFAAYGKDSYGTIGNDTTVSTLNMDGLLFIFSQALEKRTQNLKSENQQLKAEISTLKQADMNLAEENKALKSLIQQLGTRLETLESSLNNSTKAPADR
ncbi:tail fiber domain-containing protein [Emticicia agri]|uniref:Peptidase S74 domain-containing protein n=1 Tax=Emticicia agri TaxID=2492393 RepID=A0A4Q5LU98_9BACT|nr:tail fiber domain-containing protein [Emticicia agri]RYU93049.1 hypothetical protein EWM59_23970 [Emticicia agri]